MEARLTRLTIEEPVTEAEAAPKREAIAYTYSFTVTEWATLRQALREMIDHYKENLKRWPGDDALRSTSQMFLDQATALLEKVN